MTSSNGNIFRVTGHLCGEFTGPRWIPPHKGQWWGDLVFSLICVWINGWVNNREAGDLTRYRVHYDVTVMRNTPYSSPVIYGVFVVAILMKKVRVTIDQSHKSHNASVPYPTMQHFVTEMCTCVHISVTKWCIVGYLSDALWDLWDVSIGPHYIHFPASLVSRVRSPAVKMPSCWRWFRCRWRVLLMTWIWVGSGRPSSPSIEVSGGCSQMRR